MTCYLKRLHNICFIQHMFHQNMFWYKTHAGVFRFKIGDNRAFYKIRVTAKHVTRITGKRL